MESRIPFRLKVAKVYPSHTRLPDGSSRYVDYAQVEILAVGSDGHTRGEVDFLVGSHVVAAMAGSAQPVHDAHLVEEGQEFDIVVTPREG